ncbi:MAG: hypothetical protein AW12_00772 [Candidatus Accumulibacter sp. BA-94]|nr:MAG: hypothetical protein AW12_00772 [Candidatus Accumulibacter sp. BA-94]
MAADIHAVALVLDGTRNAAHLIACLEDDRRHPSVADQFQRGRQAGGPGTDDCYDRLH